MTTIPSAPGCPRPSKRCSTRGSPCTTSARVGTKGFYGGLRLRFFGPRILIEDASEKSKSTTLVYLQLGYRFNEHWDVSFDVFNLLDSQDSDIDYYYVVAPARRTGGGSQRLPHAPDRAARAARRRDVPLLIPRRRQAVSPSTSQEPARYAFSRRRSMRLCGLAISFQPNCR